MIHFLWNSEKYYRPKHPKVRNACSLPWLMLLQHRNELLSPMKK
jgi:hypothetical protein